MYKYMRVLFVALLLFGCGYKITRDHQNSLSQITSTSTNTSSVQSNKNDTIRPQLLKDSKEMFAILDDNYKSARQISDGDIQKMQIYMEKYSQGKITDFNDKETELEHDILQMMIANADYTESQLKNDKSMAQTALKEYVDVSDKTKQILGLN